MCLKSDQVEAGEQHEAFKVPEEERGGREGH